MSRYTSWGIILDDIIYPDGRSSMGTLGGGGLFAACGMRLWHQDVTVCAGVGEDFEARWLKPHGFDGSGLVVNDHPTPRAWQLLEEYGRRTQIPRVSPEAWFGHLIKTPAYHPIPNTLKALHFQGRGDKVEAKFVQALADKGVTIGAEPIIEEDHSTQEIKTIKQCLPFFEVFSPDEIGAKMLVGEKSVKEQLYHLAQLGPRVVALRQGKAGSLVYERENNEFWRVPAASAKVVDVTGAGNAYCGGLLVGWLETADIHQAASWASVSAAFAIEQVGPPPIDTAVIASAQTRADEIIHLIKREQG